MILTYPTQNLVKNESHGTRSRNSLTKVLPLPQTKKKKTLIFVNCAVFIGFYVVMC